MGVFSGWYWMKIFPGQTCRARDIYLDYDEDGRAAKSHLCLQEHYTLRLQRPLLQKCIMVNQTMYLTEI